VALRVCEDDKSRGLNCGQFCSTRASANLAVYGFAWFRLQIPKLMVAALRSDRGASRQLLLAALNQRFELLLSVPLILEYEAVLTRPQHLAACGVSSVEVGRVLDDLAAVARPVRLAFRWRPRLSDPDDDMVFGNGNKRKCQRNCDFQSA
jgi:hypothetical protein